MVKNMFFKNFMELLKTISYVSAAIITNNKATDVGERKMLRMIFYDS